MKPVPVEFNPTNVSEVRINTPCLIQGVNILDALYSLGTPAPVGTSVKSYGPNPVTTLSSRVSASIAVLSGSVSASISAISASISASMPPGGNLGSIQYKLGTYQLTGSNFFVYDSNFNALSHGNEINTSLGSFSHGEGHGVTASGYAVHAEGFKTSINNSSYYSHAEGYQTSIFSAQGAHTEGTGSTTQANYSHAEGVETSILITGVGAHTEGNQTRASGEGSHCEGKNTTTNSIAKYAHTEGFLTTGSAYYSHAEGKGTITSGESSHAEGLYSATRIGGLYAHVEGAYATGSTEGCHIEGYRCYSEDLGFSQINGKYCHVEGYQSHAGGDYSHAEGYQTTSTGSYSHAEGLGTIARGAGSHAAGAYTVSAGENSFCVGYHTEALGSLTTPQFVCGRYNTTSNNDSLFVVGNGTSDASRADLLKVNSDNTVIVNGSLTVNGNLYSNYTNFKEVGPLTPNPSTSYEATQSDNCIITYSNGADLFTATIVSIPPKDSLRLGTTFIIKNSYASPYNSYVSIDQTTGAQTIEGNTARITLSVGSSIKILLVRSGLWMIIP